MEKETETGRSDGDMKAKPHAGGRDRRTLAGKDRGRDDVTDMLCFTQRSCGTVSATCCKL